VLVQTCTVAVSECTQSHISQNATQSTGLTAVIQLLPRQPRFLHDDVQLDGVGGGNDRGGPRACLHLQRQLSHRLPTLLAAFDPSEAVRLHRALHTHMTRLVAVVASVPLQAVLQARARSEANS